MALQLADRVFVNATANTTVSFTIGSAITGYQSFSAITGGNTVYYGATDGTDWEVGLGTWSSPTLTRTTILSSSNAGSAVTFVGNPSVWIDYPSSKAVYQDAINTVTVPQLATNSVTSTTPTLGFNASNSPLAMGASVSGSYLQVLLQNWSGTANASTNYVLSNNLGTDSTYYGEFGMNSSAFSGAAVPFDFFSINNGIYFTGHDGDISIGSGNGFKTFFVWGVAGTSAHVINASGAIGLNTNLAAGTGSGTTNFGTAGQPMLSGGSAATPTWGTLPVSGGGTGQSSNLTQYGIVYGSTTTTMATTAAGTTTTVLHGNAAGSPTWSAVSLTADVSGTLPIANGGTNSTATPTNGGVGYGTGTALAYSAAGTAGQTLTSAGAASPVWVTKPVIQVATTGAAATYTIPAGCTTVKIIAVGPGGNGGASATGRATGGGGGGVVTKVLTGVTPGNTLTYTVGTASGTATTISSGTQTITTISAGSGTNGASTAYAASTTAGAAGGAATGGDINLTGQASQSSFGTSTTITTNWSSNGGGAPGWGIGGVAPVQVATAGQAGSGWGGGGSGALGNATAGSGATGGILFQAY